MLKPEENVVRFTDLLHRQRRRQPQLPTAPQFDHHALGGTDAAGSGAVTATGTNAGTIF